MKENNKSVERFIADATIPQDKRLEMIHLRSELDAENDRHDYTREQLILRQTRLIREQDKIEFKKK